MPLRSMPGRLRTALPAVICALAAVFAAGCGSQKPAASNEGAVSNQAVVPPRKPFGVPGIARGAVLIVRVRPGRSVVLRTRPHGPVIARVRDRTRFDSPVSMPVFERRGAHWLGVAAPEARGQSLGWIDAAHEKLEYSQTRLALYADRGKRRLELREGRRVVRRMQVAVGRPETPTPTGRFAVTDRINGGLSHVYGCCALALTGHQDHLPAGWPGGDRIAIHGTLPGASTNTAASAGCLRADNAHMRALIGTVPLGTPVFIHP